MHQHRNIGVIGLGYVGLPLAIAFAEKHIGVIGFDINKQKIRQLKSGQDCTGEVDLEKLRTTSLKITDDLQDLCDVDLFVVAVPTPIDQANRPELTPVIRASETVGKVLRPGAIVVYESTVYPGVTEEICGPILERISGLVQGKDFKLGYSPERINPGDKLHRLQNIVKVVSGEDNETLEILADVYGTVVQAGIHRAESIKVAEAAKVIENTQRDLNIALMNELAMIFGRMNIRTCDVLSAAGTKWNFLPFEPGLVGGHCIGVDPYYLTYKAEELGYHSQVILAGRRINDGMGKHIAEQTVKQLTFCGRGMLDIRVGILGLTFKENVPDLRNSRVPDIIKELTEYGIKVLVHDPLADTELAVDEYRVPLLNFEEMKNLDAVIIAVPHQEFVSLEPEIFVAMLRDRTGVLVDVKSIFKSVKFPETVRYWSL